MRFGRSGGLARRLHRLESESGRGGKPWGVEITYVSRRTEKVLRTFPPEDQMPKNWNPALRVVVDKADELPEELHT